MQSLPLNSTIVYVLVTPNPMYVVFHRNILQNIDMPSLIGLNFQISNNVRQYLTNICQCLDDTFRGGGALPGPLGARGDMYLSGVGDHFQVPTNSEGTPASSSGTRLTISPGDHLSYSAQEGKIHRAI